MAQIDSDSDEGDAEDDFLFGLQEDADNLSSTQETTFSEDEKNLDHYLDELLAEELSAPSAEDIEDFEAGAGDKPSRPDLPSEEDLDSLLDSLINQEINSPKSEVAGKRNAEPEISSDENQEDTPLDSLLDDLTRDAQETEDLTGHSESFADSAMDSADTDLLFKENGEIDQDFTDSLEDTASEIAADDLDMELSENETDLAGESIEEIAAEPVAEEQAEPQEEEKSDEDLWAAAFADQQAVENEETKEETADAPAAAEPVAEEQAEPQEEEKSDEDLWAAAFADQQAVENEETKEETTDAPAAEDAAETLQQEDGAEDIVSSEEETEEASIAELPEEEDEGLEIPETAQMEDKSEDDEGDWDEIENQFDDEYESDAGKEGSPAPAKKKKFNLALPETRTGKLILGGSVLALLLTGGGVYFALQTLAPPELMQMGKTESAAPAALTPGQGSEENKGAAPKIPGSETAPAPVPGAETGTDPDLARELTQVNEPKGTGKGLEVTTHTDPAKALEAALAPSTHAVELAAIMPVAYDVNDIRVLSFSVEMEMSDAESAQAVRNALPVFEKITVKTVDALLENKFFNDILYVQEKLQNNLQNNFNKTLEGGGRVKKVKFKDFLIQ